MSSIISLIVDQITYNYHYLLILGTLWLTYSYVIFRGGFVSDDLQGIDQYDGTLQYPVELPDGSTEKDSKGEVVKRQKLCYGTLSKWVRYHIVGGHFPSRHRYPKKLDGTEGDIIPCGKVPARHHTLSVVIQSIAVILTYQFLLTVTSPMVALMTILLFIVHPTCLQAVAWPSAIGYILSLVCISASLLIGHWTMNHLSLIGILIGVSTLTFFQVWGVYAQGIPMFTWIIFLALGQWHMAAISFIISTVISAVNLRGYIVHRKDQFKKQNMAESTSFNWRKPIVALKTIAYYIYLALWPSRLGLYHTWGFHYDKKMELWDWRARTGLGILVGSGILFYYGSQDIRLAVVWFYAFILLFLNWITAQQWVTERYLYIPIIGLCLIASALLPLWAYLIIFGMLLSRTLCHVATYDNEVRFYLSNIWNFPKSEVAHGNLGVAYASVGLAGAANDNWIISSLLNPEYDVPFYNIYSKTKTNGITAIRNGAYDEGLRLLASAIPMMEKVLTCKVLHFPEMWEKERDELKIMVANPTGFLIGELQRLSVLKMKLTEELNKTTDLKRRSEIVPSIQNTDSQITNLINYLRSKGVQVENNPEKALLSGVFNKTIGVLNGRNTRS